MVTKIGLQSFSFFAVREVMFIGYQQVIAERRRMDPRSCRQNDGSAVL